MRVRSGRHTRLLLTSLAGAAVLALGVGNAAAKGQVAIGVTETIASYNPYADSISMGYAIWCQVYGCLGIYDYHKGEYAGMLVERWEVDKTDNNVWTFHLKHGVKRQNDGKELAAEDVVHSINRINTDPQSKQKQNVSPIKEVVAFDKYTVKIVTNQPTGSRLPSQVRRLSRRRTWTSSCTSTARSSSAPSERTRAGARKTAGRKHPVVKASGASSACRCSGGRRFTPTRVPASR